MFKFVNMYSHRQNTARNKRGPPSKPCFKMIIDTQVMGRISPFGIAIRYGQDGPGVESWWRRGFPLPSRSALGPTQPPLRWVSGNSRGYNGRNVALTTQPHLKPRLKKEKRNTSIVGLRGLPQGEVYLYLYLYLHTRSAL
jgi:hypothetical protein